MWAIGRCGKITILPSPSQSKSRRPPPEVKPHNTHTAPPVDADRRSQHRSHGISLSLRKGPVGLWLSCFLTLLLMPCVVGWLAASNGPASPCCCTSIIALDAISKIKKSRGPQFDTLTRATAVVVPGVNDALPLYQISKHFKPSSGLLFGFVTSDNTVSRGPGVAF